AVGQLFKSFRPAVRCAHVCVAMYFDLAAVVLLQQRLQKLRDRMAPEIRRNIPDLETSPLAAVVRIGEGASSRPPVPFVPASMGLEQSDRRNALAVVHTGQQGARR